jgi:hypothetical protein
MNINALSVVKFVASGLVGLGTGKIVGKIIKDHVQPETLIDKVTVTAAAWVISAVVTKATKDYTTETIDDTVEAVTDIIHRVKDNLKLAKINRGESTFDKEDLDQSWFRKNEKDQWVQISQEDWNEIHGTNEPKIKPTKKQRTTN